jgi:CelD/BcsL family acetyltransferase involved in cellulose biosynthesis
VHASVQTLGSAGDLDALRDAWESLIARCPGHSQAQTPVYGALAIERALARGAKIRLIAARDNSGLVGLWPLVLRREGAFRVSCGNEQELNLPLVARDAGAGALEAILDAAMSLRCDIFRFKFVRPESELARLLGRPPYAALRRRQIFEKGYEVGMTRYATWQDYLDLRSRKNHRNRQRRLRRLCEQGEVEFGWCRTPADAAAVLNWVFDAKSRWARERRIDAQWLEARDVRDFWLELTKRMDLTNLPLVAYLKFEHRPIAGLLNLIGDSSVELFITAHDEAFSQYSPGEQLIEFLMQWCVENRRDADLGVTRSDHKERLADRTPLVVSYSFELSAWARLASRPLFKAGRAVWRSPRKAARLFSASGRRSLASDSRGEKI